MAENKKYFIFLRKNPAKSKSWHNYCRVYFRMEEPLNSYEVSLAILLMRPGTKLDVTWGEVAMVVGRSRTKEISEWCSKFYTKHWYNTHK